MSVYLLLFIALAMASFAFLRSNAYCEMDQTEGFGAIPDHEMSALRDLYVATNGTGWNFCSTDDNYYRHCGQWHFDEVANPCDEKWEGVYCRNVSGTTHVYRLELKNMNLAGTLPSSLGNFSELCDLDIETNHFLTGTIPPELGNLQALQTLDLMSCNLHGQIPSSLGKLTLLTEMDLMSNKLTGGVPAEFGYLTNLQTLYLFYNTLNGTIPPEIGRLSNLKQLELYGNDMVGTIPPELCWLQNVGLLMISSNKFTGTIPECIGNMTSLYEITLDYCKLNGTIPASITQLSKMNYLYLESNEFTGTLPEDIGNMEQMYIFHINNNQLRGHLPESLGQMTSLQDFTANNNQFTGQIPIFSSALQQLDLSFNQLSQQIPDIFGAPKLYRVVLTSNQLTGSLPGNISHGIQALELDSNLLSKHLPLTLFECIALNDLYLTDNLFSGPIPVQINKLYHIQNLEMGNNRFTGEIPGLVSNMSRMVTFTLDNNHLTGTIPTDVGHLSRSLFTLLLNHNHLSGTIPPEMGQMKSLTLLSVNNNQLTGTVPVSLNRMSSLNIFFVYHNILSGPLTNVFDSTLQKNLLYVDVSNNQFTGNLPLEVFRIMKLYSFAGVGNCFTGSIPSDVCGAANLTSLALDGLMSATDCQMRFFPKWTSSYGLPNSIKGGFPSCLFAMPKLRNLHLSGNGLTGTIPADVVISHSLADLSLSHNNIKGEVPPQLQTHNFTNLDLSYNKFRGTLNSGIYSTYGQNGTLSMQVNRLSGVIPSVLRYAQGITILDGNLYECNAARSDLPEHDSYAHIYECGSNTFNYTLYFWLAVIFTAACAGLAAVVFADCSDLIKRCREWMCVFEVTNVECENLVNFGEFVAVLRKVSVYLTLVILLIAMPIYLGLSFYYNTYNYEYAWVATGCYLSGVVPTAIVLLMFIFFGACMVYAMYVVHERTSDAAVMDMKKAQQEEGKHHDEAKWTWMQYSQVTLLVLFNLLLVTTVNILYVYVDHNYSSGIVRTTQITVSMFKIIWKNLIVRWLLGVASEDFETRTAPKNARGQIVDVDGDLSMRARRSSLTMNETASKGHNLSLAVFVTIFNNIAAPFIATCYVSTNCFYNVVQSPERVVVSYEYAMCAYGQFDGNYTACNAFSGVEVHTTTYDPPYIYSFQCSSTFITTYSSIYVFMFTMEAFFIPLVMWCLAYYHRRFGGPRVGKNKLLIQLEAMIPKILQSVKGLPSLELTSHTDSLTTQVESNRATDQSLSLFANQNPHMPYFECAVFIVKLLNMFSILSTFGLILPPLAVVCCVSVLSATWNMQLFIGRFVANVRGVAGAAGLVQLLEDDAKHAAWMFLDSIWMLAPFCVIFYALFLFDVIGDAVGWQRALWAPLLIFCGSVAVWLIYRWKQKKWVGWWQSLVKRSRQGFMRREVSSDGTTVQYANKASSAMQYTPLATADDGMMKVLTQNCET